MQDFGERERDAGPANRLFEAFVPPLVRARLNGVPAGPLGPSVERLHAAVLFADLTGFSALAEEFAPRGTRGAEDLRDLLNRFFGLVVRLVDLFGGQVLSFPGDAIVAIWVIEPGADDDMVRHAVSCALSMQQALGAAPSVGSTPLRLHAGVGTGDLCAAHVGGSMDRWHLVAVGDALLQATAAAAAAGPGAVVVSNQAWALIHSGSDGVPQPPAGVRVRGVAPAARPPRHQQTPRPPVDRLRSFVPRSVQAKVDAGQTEWLGEFRRVSVLFVNIGPIDTEAEAAFDRLQSAAVVVQTAVDRYGGSINQMIADDKGTVVACGWGLSMHAYGDDAVRAAHAALCIDRDLREIGLRASFGLATGEVFTGLRGDASRCDYAMIGSAVNLAARLMELAREEILCDGASLEAAASRIRFEMVGARPVRGFGRDIKQYRLVEGAPSSGATEIVGRQAEQGVLAERLDAVLRVGQGSVVVVEGDAGIGKSRLLGDLLDRAARRAVRTVVAAGDAIERSRPYHAWHRLFGNLLDLGGVRGADESRVGALLASQPQFQPFAPLLNSVLELGFEETERSRDVSPRGRALMTRDLLVYLFERCIGPHPALVVLDDTHWFDSASWALVEGIQRTMPAVLLVIATRPIPHEHRSPELRRICALETTLVLSLEPLSADATRELVCQRLRARVLDPAVERLILDKADGHPFFAEQLANALDDRQLVRVDRGVCRFTGARAAGESLALPNTVQVMVSSRIDQLTIGQQLTMKVASVLGQSLGLPLLQAIYPLEAGGDVVEHCDALVEQNLLRVVSRTPPVYAFKHALIQEVAYNLLPFSQRRLLHAQVARWLELFEPGGLDASFPLLAHHWSCAEVTERALFYLEKAADQSLSRFANLEAIRFYAEALATDARSAGAAETNADVALPRRRVSGGDARRVRWQRRLGDAHANLGEWPAARRSFENALALIGQDLPTSSWGWTLGIGREVARQCGHRLIPRLRRPYASDAGALLREAVCAYERIGAISYFTERLPPMFYSLLAALNLAERLGPNPDLALVYADVGNIAGIVPSHRLARLYNRMARDSADALGSPAVSARVLGRASVYRIAVGDWDACADLDRSLDLCDHVADLYQWEESAAIRARAAHLRGEYELAERLGREIRRRAAATGSSAHEIWGLDAEVWGLWYRGHHRRAADLAVEGLGRIAEAARPDRIPTLDFLGALALARLESGDVTGAVEATRRIEGVMAASPRPGHFATLGLSAAAETWTALWELGPAAAHGADAAVAAHRACQVLERYARLNPPARARAALWRGCIEWLRGRRRAAHHSWRRCLEEADRFSLPYERGRAHYEIARHLQAGDAARTHHYAAAEREFVAIDARFELSRLATIDRTPNAAPAGV